MVICTVLMVARSVYMVVKSAHTNCGNSDDLTIESLLQVPSLRLNI